MVRLRLTRDQIAKIVGNDPEAIRQFERVFESTNMVFDSPPDDLSFEIGSAQNTANEALARFAEIDEPFQPIVDLSVIEARLEALEMAPVAQEAFAEPVVSTGGYPPQLGYAGL